VVAITGATGTLFGIRAMQLLREHARDVEIHLVTSPWARRTIVDETPFTIAAVRSLAHRVWNEKDQGAAIASGSFTTLGMLVAPCTMKTLGEIAHGYGADLIARAADVTLKERRRLVLAVRETPLSDVHLENMLKLSRAGAVIAPPMPHFYARPKSVDEIVTFAAIRLLDAAGIELTLPNDGRWTGWNEG
jgi:4-hydroxy-3-polyprenylbenzoate decarboxylase